MAQINLRTFKVAVPCRTWTHVSAAIEILQRVVRDEGRDIVEGIPTTTIPAAIRNDEGAASFANDSSMPRAGPRPWTSSVRRPQSSDPGAGQHFSTEVVRPDA